MRNDQVASLEAKLRTRLQRALREDSSWGKPFGLFISLVREKRLTAFLFGGTVRDLLLHDATLPPRDLDLVVDDAAFSYFLDEFPAESSIRNRFGGLKCKFNTVEIDVWPIERTWAFQKGYRADAKFYNLPSTAFFNLDAVVAEIAPRQGKPRKIYECCFFDGVLKQQIDYNLEITDYPELNAVRGFVLAQRTGFHFSNRFCRFLFDLCIVNKRAAFESVQLQHYKRVKIPDEVLRRNLDELRKVLNRNAGSTFLPYFPASTQREFSFEPEPPFFEHDR